MVTQAEIVERDQARAREVSAADIDRVIASIWIAEGPDRYPGMTGNRLAKHWQDSTHNALLLHLADLMDQAEVSEWEYGEIGVTTLRTDIRGNLMITTRYRDCRNETSPDYPPTSAEFAQRYGDYRNDPDLIAEWRQVEIAAVMMPDVAGHCNTCAGPVWYDAIDWSCYHCGTLAVECEAGCYDIGAWNPRHDPRCWHHGAPALPAVLMNHFGNDPRAVVDWLTNHGGPGVFADEFGQQGSEVVPTIHALELQSDRDSDSDSDSHSDSISGEEASA